MKTHPVSSGVNSPDNDTPDLLARVDVEVGQTLSCFGVSKRAAINLIVG